MIMNGFIATVAFALLIAFCAALALGFSYLQVVFVLALTAADVTPLMCAVWLMLSVAAWQLVVKGLVSLFTSKGK